MEIEWDEQKRIQTLRERGLDFADVVLFEQDTMTTVEDIRFRYGEVRYVTTGMLHHRLCVLCWTLRNKRMRVISLRKANEREKRSHTQTFK